MAYIAPGDVRGPSGFTDSSLFSDAYITKKIAAAEGLINGKIVDAYLLPLPDGSIPDIIVEASLELTIALLQIDQYGDEAKDGDKGWKRRMDYYLNDPEEGGDKNKPMGILDQIRKLKLKLLDPATLQELPRSDLRTVGFYPTDASSAPGGASEPVITMKRKF